MLPLPAVRGTKSPRPLMTAALFPPQGTYVSADAGNRGVALEQGFVTDCQHPKEVCILGSNEMLVVDLDNVLFDDKEAAVEMILRTARSEVPVAVHTFNSEHPAFWALHFEPLVIIALTQREAVEGVKQLIADRDARREPLRKAK